LGKKQRTFCIMDQQVNLFSESFLKLLEKSNLKIKFKL